MFLHVEVDLRARWWCPRALNGRDKEWVQSAEGSSYCLAVRFQELEHDVFVFGHQASCLREEPALTEGVALGVVVAGDKSPGFVHCLSFHNLVDLVGYTNLKENLGVHHAV